MSEKNVRERLEILANTVKPGHFVYTYPPHKIYPKIEKELDFEAAWNNTPNSDLNVYVHIPFCRQKCGYCNIESIPIKQGASFVNNYLETLKKEFDMYEEVLEDFNPITVYVGGGTPSYLTEEQMFKLFNEINENVSSTKNLEEFCIEISPDSTTPEKLDIMKEFGISRVSLGVQSFNENQINSMGRKYSSEDPIDIFAALQERDFENINIDIIYGLPEQDMNLLAETLMKTIELEPATVSMYPLNIKPLTGYWKKFGDKGLDKDKIASMYEQAKEILISSGYKQDTRLRFVLPKQGRYAHKDETIKGTPVKGFGAAAQSYAEYVHYRPPYSVTHCKSDINQYMEDISQGRHPARAAFFLDDEERMRRVVIMNLRHSEFNRKLFKDKFGTGPEEAFPAEFSVLYKEGYLTYDGDHINMTPKGYKNANIISNLFFSPQVQKMRKEYVYK